MSEGPAFFDRCAADAEDLLLGGSVASCVMLGVIDSLCRGSPMADMAARQIVPHIVSFSDDPKALQRLAEAFNLGLDLAIMVRARAIDQGNIQSMDEHTAKLCASVMSARVSACIPADFVRAMATFEASLEAIINEEKRAAK